MCNEPQLADYFPSWPLITNFLSVNAKYARIVHIGMANVNWRPHLKNETNREF